MSMLPTPWEFPEMSGYGVRLVPAEASHAPALFAVTPPDTFRYFITWPRRWELSEFAAWFESYRTCPTERMYVAIDSGCGEVLGCTAFIDVDPTNRSMEVGGTWFAPGSRGTHVNPACKRMMLAHAFERLGCVRVTIKCNAKNLHSQAAIRKLGAVYEGVLRRHRVQGDGQTRDTMYFSVLGEEWPMVRDRLDQRLGARRAG